MHFKKLYLKIYCFFFFIFTLLSGASKGFIKTLKGFVKALKAFAEPFDTPQRNVNKDLAKVLFWYNFLKYTEREQAIYWRHCGDLFDENIQILTLNVYPFLMFFDIWNIREK